MKKKQKDIICKEFYNFEYANHYTNKKYDVWKIYSNLNYFYYLVNKLNFKMFRSKYRGCLLAKPSQHSKFELEYIEGDIIFSKKLKIKEGKQYAKV